MTMEFNKERACVWHRSMSGSIIIYNDKDVAISTILSIDTSRYQLQ